MSKTDHYIRTGGDPILKTACAPAELGEDLSSLMALMERVCKKSRTGVGLAAPQVGVAKRVIFVYCRDRRGTVRGRFLINPMIVKASESTEVEEEGCLSYPGVRKPIRRHRSVTVEYLDERRTPRSLESFGFEARVIQHEVDHLDGVCKVGDPDYPADGYAQPQRKNVSPRHAALEISLLAAGVLAMSLPHRG